MFGLPSRREVEYLETKIKQLEKENKKLNERLNEKKRLFNPSWRKELTVSPYIFDKYISDIGKPVIGGYHVNCDDGSYYIVRIDKSMNDGYIRYDVPFEEPYGNCKKCNKTFRLAFGYPENNADFCSYRCYEEFVN